MKLCILKCTIPDCPEIYVVMGNEGVLFEVQKCIDNLAMGNHIIEHTLTGAKCLE